MQCLLYSKKWWTGSDYRNSACTGCNARRAEVCWLCSIGPTVSSDSMLFLWCGLGTLRSQIHNLNLNFEKLILIPTVVANISRFGFVKVTSYSIQLIYSVLLLCCTGNQIQFRTWVLLLHVSGESCLRRIVVLKQLACPKQNIRLERQRRNA